MNTPDMRLVPVEAVQRLILATDSYGVRYLDSDDMSEQAEELQAATEAMKAILAAPVTLPRELVERINNLHFQAPRDDIWGVVTALRQALTAAPSEPAGREEALAKLRVLRDQARKGTDVSDPDEWVADELDAILALFRGEG